MLKVCYIPRWLTELQEYRGNEKRWGKRKEVKGVIVQFVIFVTVSIPKNRDSSLESSGFEQSREESYADV